MTGSGEIVHLNVGGTRFSTTRLTLTWVPDSFFTALLSGRISSLQDESGAFFIDRDPTTFSVILNYLRSRDIDLKTVNIRALRVESEFFGITPLSKRLLFLEDLNYSSCGDVLFYGYLPKNEISPEKVAVFQNEPNAGGTNRSIGKDSGVGSSAGSAASTLTTKSDDGSSNLSSVPGVHRSANGENARRIETITTGVNPGPGTVFRVPETHGSGATVRNHSRSASSNGNAVSGTGSTGSTFSWGTTWNNSHSRTSSVDLRSTHSRNPSFDARHSRNSSADLNKIFRNELSVLSQGNVWIDPLRVRIVRAHQNWIAVAYAHFVSCYRLKDSSGWQQVFTSPRVDNMIDRLAINAKMSPGQTASNSGESFAKMVAIAAGSVVLMWAVTDEGNRTDIGRFSLPVPVEFLFFIGSQLVALSQSGKIGVWHSTSKHVLVQDIIPIMSFDTAGSFLLLGCSNGAISYIDMQKFPLRMKDNDLLVTELYRDPSNEPITAISVYLTPKTSLSGNWIEIAYGTQSGMVRVIVQHPETVGHGPQACGFVGQPHRSPVTKVKLSEKYLVSVCSEYNHVRSWTMTRFRGMISTHPGSTPLSSFKIVALEEVDSNIAYGAGNDFGPYGEQDDEQVFIQKVVPETDQLYVRLASNGKRICTIKSVDSTTITSFCVHECEGSSRDIRPRRFIFTGHSSGAIQMWDLTSALDLSAKGETVATQKSGGGPTPEELLRLLDQCDLSTQVSHASTPCPSRCGDLGIMDNSLLVASSSGVSPNRLKASNVAFLSQQAYQQQAQQQHQQQQQQPPLQQTSQPTTQLDQKGTVTAIDKQGKENLENDNSKANSPKKKTVESTK